MKILHIIPSLGIGGTEKVLERLTTNLKIYEHVIVNLGYSGNIEKSFLKKNIRVKNYRLRAFNFPFILIRLLIFFNKERPDLIQSWLYKADFVSIFFRIIFNFKNIIWNIRATKTEKSSDPKRKLEIWILSKFALFVPIKIICCGKKAMNEHILLGYPEDKMILINNGIDSQLYFNKKNYKKNSLRSNFKIKEEQFILGCVGRYSYLKGVDNLIKAFNYIKKENKSKIVMAIGGRGINSRNKLINKLIKETNYESQFILLGQLYDVPKFLKDLDFYCSPSRFEGFPNVIAEAMSMGLPCIVSNAGDSEMIISNCGICFGESTPENIALGINKYLNLTKIEKSSLGENARKRIINNFSLKKMSLEYSDVYKKIINQKKI